MVYPAGFEPATPSVSRKYSNRAELRVHRTTGETQVRCLSNLMKINVNRYRVKGAL